MLRLYCQQHLYGICLETIVINISLFGSNICQEHSVRKSHVWMEFVQKLLLATFLLVRATFISNISRKRNIIGIYMTNVSNILVCWIKQVKEISWKIINSNNSTRVGATYIWDLLMNCYQQHFSFWEHRLSAAFSLKDQHIYGMCPGTIVSNIFVCSSNM